MTKKPTLFIVAPHAADVEFKLKMASVGRVATDLGIAAIWAVGAERNVSIGLGNLRNADIILADLSFERPSCYFEVGFAQALGKAVALIAKTGTAIHQVIGGDAVLFYNSLSAYEDVVRQALKSSDSALKTRVNLVGGSDCVASHGTH